MDEDHYIAMIELKDENYTYRKNLKPGDEPKAVFKVHTYIGNLTAKEYCTVHGLWQS
jgi:superoxide reductase